MMWYDQHASWATQKCKLRLAYVSMAPGREPSHAPETSKPDDDDQRNLSGTRGEPKRSSK